MAADDRQAVLEPIGAAAAATSTSSVTTPPTREHRLEEQRKLGVYFEDDYDYLKHLRDANELVAVVEERCRIGTETGGRVVHAGKDVFVPPQSNVQLPSSLFETPGVQLETGLLNQAAPLPGACIVFHVSVWTTHVF